MSKPKLLSNAGYHVTDYHKTAIEDGEIETTENAAVALLS